MAVINPEVISSNIKLKRTPINVTKLFGRGGGGGGSIVRSGGGSIIPRSSAIVGSSGSSIIPDSLDPLDTPSDLESKVLSNQKKITLLKNILKTHQNNHVRASKLEEINSLLKDIGNALALDFANRITEEKSRARLLRKQASKNKIEKAKGLFGGLMGVVEGTAKKLLAPVTDIFQKAIASLGFIAAGIVANKAFDWLRNPENQEKLNSWFQFIQDHWKTIAIGLGTLGALLILRKIYKFVRLIVNVTKALWRFGKNVFKTARAMQWVFRRPGFAKILKRFGIAMGGRNIVRFFSRAGKVLSPAGKIGTSIGKQIFRKVGSKIAVKSAAKGAAKVGLKKIPILGLGLGILFAAQRAMAGDMAGASLELASGAASTVPGLGTAASFAIDAALMAKDIQGANNIDSRAIGGSITKDVLYQVHKDEIIRAPFTGTVERAQRAAQILKKSEQFKNANIIPIDLPPITANLPETPTNDGEATEAPNISSSNGVDQYRYLTSEIYGIYV